MEAAQALYRGHDVREISRSEAGAENLSTTAQYIDGVIEEARIFGDYFSRREPGEIETALVGAAHQEAALRARLAPFEVADYFVNVGVDELLTALI